MKTPLLFLALACFLRVQAATFSATVDGTVLDATGTPVAAAQIRLTSLSSGKTIDAISNGEGQYKIPDLAPGAYELEISKYGFATAKLRKVLDPRREWRPSVKLALAADAEPSSLDDLRSRLVQLERQLARVKQVGERQGGEEVLIASANPTSIPVVPAQPAVAPTPPAAPATPAVDLQTPFADFDWTWMNGNSRQHDSPLDTKYFSGEFRADTFYGIDTNQPRDHSMGGSSEVFRSGEVQLEDLSVGGDFHVGNVRGRVLALFGMFSATTVRNDASPAVGQWDVRAAYKYISEAWGGYHFNVNHGLNVDAGIFVSYVGLFSYHNFDNWAYQPSYVSSNTPWFFNGVRVQWFPTNHLKIEPWFINGWQSYNKFNGHPGVGGQIKWTPNGWLTVIGNQYAVGNDNVGLPNRGRYHTDDSIEVKYYDNPNARITRAAFTLTGDAGCETGDGVTCHGGKGGPKQSFLGYMAYNRIWWNKDRYAFTLGGGKINNPGRYLTLVLPVNGADAISGTPYFPNSPGLPFKAYDGTATFDWMPTQFFTFRTEVGYRHSNVPYWSGRGGITPPNGNNGAPSQYACNDGAPSGAVDLAAARIACGNTGVWFPDLRKGQGLVSFAFMVKF